MRPYQPFSNRPSHLSRTLGRPKLSTAIRRALIPFCCVRSSRGVFASAIANALPLFFAKLHLQSTDLMLALVKRRMEAWLFRTGRRTAIYARLCPSARRWADYLRLHGGFESIGEDCEINRDAVITDPYLVRIGNSVTLSSCSLISHDGSTKQLQNATGLKLDAVGTIDIKDNCFIGYGAIILRNVTIGPNSIVAAGAVVTKDVPPNTIVAGIPARPLGTIEELAENLQEEAKQLPWHDLIQKRAGAFDAEIEPKLKAARSAYFWRNRK